jgi:hypothetical protein
MSPLRKWMTEHGRPSWYSWVVVVLAPIIAATAMLIVSLKINAQSIAREREARQASEQAFCGIVVLLDDAWTRTPPTTQSGRELAVAVDRARHDYRCR